MKVIDASALIALVFDEPGADRVREELIEGVFLSVVNWAEVLTRVADKTRDKLPPERLEAMFARMFGEAIHLYGYYSHDARKAADLRAPTRALGLSLGDRSCLALASRLRVPALTADTDREKLSVGVRVELARQARVVPAAGEDLAVYDRAAGRFVEVPLPPPFGASLGERPILRP